MNCQKCRVYDEEKGKYRYHQAKKSTWRPPSGMDPRLREYKCRCGNTFYELLTDTKLEREKLHVPVTQ